jgi:hypothetical protein
MNSRAGSDFTGRPSAPAPIQPDARTTSESEVTSVAPQSGHSKFAQKILRKQKQPPAPTLFMGNLPFEIVIQDIRTMLEVHRNSKSKQKEEKSEDPQLPRSNDKWLKKIRLGTFEDSGKCKGCVHLMTGK